MTLDLTIGIEVTELVEPIAIHNCKSTCCYKAAEWNRNKFLDHLVRCIRAKDKPAQVKGGPYHAYWLVIHCDEPEPSPNRVREF
jgi:hypothetical protein